VPGERNEKRVHQFVRLIFQPPEGRISAIPPKTGLSADQIIPIDRDGYRSGKKWALARLYA